MSINRRTFFYLLIARPTQLTSVRVAVLETFDIGQASAALLVHHVEATERDRFARWLQALSKTAIRVRSKTGEDVPARIFRVRMCFGRGLILLERPMQIHERDVLTIVA